MPPAGMMAAAVREFKARGQMQSLRFVVMVQPENVAGGTRNCC